MAILTLNQGWKATVSQGTEGLFISPWSVAVDGEQRFKIVTKSGSSYSTPTASTPPSSRQALEFLVEFCTLHGIRSQLFAALAAVMTFPTHNYYGSSAALPIPRVSSNPGSSSIKPNVGQLLEHLSYYIVLSCHHKVVVSSLCGVF